MEFETNRLLIKTEMIINDKRIDFEYYKNKSIAILNIKESTGLETGFVCYSKLTGEEICHVGLICYSDGKIEISYGTNEQFRNQKYMSEALPAVIDWIFVNTSVNDLYARISNNDISEHLLQKCGFSVTCEKFSKPGKLYKLSRNFRNEKNI